MPEPKPTLSVMDLTKVIHRTLRKKHLFTIDGLADDIHRQLERKAFKFNEYDVHGGPPIWRAPEIEDELRRALFALEEAGVDTDFELHSADRALELLSMALESCVEADVDELVSAGEVVDNVLAKVSDWTDHAHDDRRIT